MDALTWLLLLYALPTSRNAERVNLWRKLRKFGAVQLKSSGYLLPDEPVHLERLQWLAGQIRDAGGQATLIRVAEIHGVSNQETIDMFNEARAHDYRDLVMACQQFVQRQNKKHAPELEAELAKLNHRFGEIREVDYFKSAAAHDAQVWLSRAAKTLSPRETARDLEKLNPSDFMGKTWLTRPRPGVDRTSSAWLIRKFIDPNARFVFATSAARHPKSLPFDMADVEFSHHGDDCTFETLVKRFGITDKAVLKMAEMVHDADLEDGKFGHQEALGINAVLSGWAKSPMTDADLLAKGMECFEGLYQQLRK